MRQTEHGCYDCSNKRKCAGCDIERPTPSHWVQGSVNIDSDIKRCYEKLLCEVVRRAAVDYRQVRRDLKRKKNVVEAQAAIESIEEFMLSDRLAIFTSIDGKHILDRLKGETI